MVDATFTFDGTSIDTGLVTVSPSSSVALALTDITGVESVTWTCVGTNTAAVAEATITAAITPAGAPQGVTATLAFPAGADGQCYRIQCSVKGAAINPVVRYGLVGSVNTAGIVPAAKGERATERDPVQGWTDVFNASIGIGAWLLLSGGTMSGNIGMGGNAITGIGYLESNTANPAASGIVRLAEGDFVVSRDTTNAGDVQLIGLPTGATNTIRVGDATSGVRLEYVSNDATLGHVWKQGTTTVATLTVTGGLDLQSYTINTTDDVSCDNVVCNTVNGASITSVGSAATWLDGTGVYSAPTSSEIGALAINGSNAMAADLNLGGANEITTTAGNDVVLNAPTGRSVDVEIAGVKQLDVSAGLADFQGATVRAGRLEAGVNPATTGTGVGVANNGGLFGRDSDGVTDRAIAWMDSSNNPILGYGTSSITAIRGGTVSVRIGPLDTEEAVFTAGLADFQGGTVRAGVGVFGSGSAPTSGDIQMHEGANVTWRVGANSVPLLTAAVNEFVVGNFTNLSDLDLRASASITVGYGGGTHLLLSGNLADFQSDAVTTTGAMTAATFNGVALTTGGSAATWLDGTGAYSAPTASETGSLAIDGSNAMAADLDLGGANALVTTGANDVVINAATGQTVDLQVNGTDELTVSATTVDAKSNLITTTNNVEADRLHLGDSPTTSVDGICLTHLQSISFTDGDTGLVKALAAGSTIGTNELEISQTGEVVRALPTTFHFGASGSEVMSVGTTVDITSSVKVGASASTVGFFGNAGTTKQTLTGARNNPEAALANLITLLAGHNLLTDSTTAS